MKQFVTRLLLLMLAAGMVLSLAACGGDKEPSSEPESEPEEIVEPEPEPEVENPIELPTLKEKLNAGIKRNADTVGWIYIPGTSIDDAVLQAADNDYYLRLNEDKVYDIYGSYFMDYECKQGDRNALSRNNILYGHSDLRDNKDGKDFSQLFRYLDEEFLEQYPYIFYSTRDEEMVFQIFSVVECTVDYSKPNHFYYLTADPPTTEFLALIDEAKLRSNFIVDLPVGASDKILILSTCKRANDERLLVIGKLMPAGQKLPSTIEVEVNPSPKR